MTKFKTGPELSKSITLKLKANLEKHDKNILREVEVENKKNFKWEVMT